MVASLEQSGGLADFTLCEDVLDDLKGHGNRTFKHATRSQAGASAVLGHGVAWRGNNRAGGGMPTYLFPGLRHGLSLSLSLTEFITLLV